MATLDSKASGSTLVDDNEEHRQRSGGTPQPLPTSSTMPDTPSPFSAYFDPNAPTPLTPPVSLTSPMTTIVRDTPARATTDAWTNSLSMSLSTLASQFATASQALSAIPAISSSSSSSSGADPEALAVVRQAQTALEQELEALKEQVAYMLEHGRSSDKDKERATDAISPEPVGLEAFEGRLQGIEQNIERLDEAIRLDQARMYPRLQNSVVTTNKMRITPLMMANGKTPQNFPATKGEFEHLTKERYEYLMKSYGLPVKGDTAAKREALREFIGLTPAAKT